MRRPHTFPIVLAAFTAFLNLYAAQPLLPLLARVFNATQFAVSLTMTAAMIAVAISAPLVGRLGDIFGRRRVIVTSAFILAMATGLAGTARGLNELIAWRFVQGLATPGVFAVTVAYIHDQWPASSLGPTIAAYVSGTVVGGFAGRAIAGVIASAVSWRVAFVTLGVLNFAAAVAIWLWLPAEQAESRHHQPDLKRRSGAAHLTNRELLMTYAVGFCVLFTLAAMFTHVGFRLAAPPFGLSSAALGWLFSVYLIGAAITPFTGPWIDKHGHRAAVLTSMAIASTGAALTLAGALPIVVIGLTLCCTGAFVAQATATSHVGALARHARGVAVGLYVMFYYLGGSVGAALPALFWDLGGWPACVGLVIAVQSTIALIAWLSWRDYEAGDATPAEVVG